MSANSVLSRLEGVRCTGQGRWIALCPAHDDRHPSLSIRELEDRRVLVHCHAACATENVLTALGLTWADVMPERLTDEHLRRERRPFDALNVLQCIATEAEIATVAADNIANRIALTDADRDRARLAAIRLRAAEELARG